MGEKQSGLFGEMCQTSCILNGLGMCVCSWGGNLCFLKSGKTVNTEVYINILEAHLLSSIDDLFSDEKIALQQDLAPAYNSKTKEFLHLHNIEVLEWPANSPDLNNLNLCGN